MPEAEKDGLHEYKVWSTYKVDGVAYVRAKSAVRKGLAADAEVIFSEPYGETKMRARRLLPSGSSGAQQ